MTITQKLFVAVVVFVIMVVLFWPVIVLFLLSFPHNPTLPPIPEIQYGEFPFRLEYKIDGDLMVVEDTLVGKYFGVVSSATETRNQWDGYFVDGTGEIVLLETDEVKIVYPIDSVATLMGDPGGQRKKIYILERQQIETPYFPNKIAKEWDPTSGWIWRNQGVIPDDELLEEYNIEIISWEIAPPIENTFK